MLLQSQVDMLEHLVVPTCISSAAFWLPNLINLSAWLEHAPFAFWLIQVTKPRLIVELGTHQGYSYFAFCQAVQQLNLPTRCYAIDTWEGDEHSGFYGEDVFADVKGNNQQYAAFSQLIRSTFDDALDNFQDKSIDLLHIDGRHFYADVKHDFEKWLPKLSDCAVVLFHDTSVREKGFGVYQLWDEVRQSYPHFEFIHGNGLGVLGVGKFLPAALQDLFNAEEVDDIHAMYSRLGGALSDRYQLIAQAEQHQNNVQVLKDHHEQAQDNANREIKKLQHQVSGVMSALEMNKADMEAQKKILMDIYSSKSWRFMAWLKASWFNRVFNFL